MNKSITLGAITNIFTIITVLSTCLYTIGVMSNKIEENEKRGKIYSSRINTNEEDIVDLKVDVGKILAIVERVEVAIQK